MNIIDGKAISAKTKEELRLEVSALKEKGISVDVEGFKKLMQEQKERAKAATAKISVTGDIKYAKVEEEVGSTEFLASSISCFDTISESSLALSNFSAYS